MTRTRWHRLSRVLAVSTSGHPVGAELQALLSHLTQAEVHRLIAAASKHGVTGFLCQALLPLPELDVGLRTELEAARSRVLRDHLRALSELTVIAEALDALGVPWLVFKGPALAAVAYPQPHLREYVDLDVLVPAEHLGRVLTRLTDVGCRNVDRDWAALTRDKLGEVKLVSPGGVLLDLHWELFSEWRVRQDFQAPTTAELMSRARTVRLQGVDVLTLDPMDTLLHVALHASTSGGWRLLWLKDVTLALDALDEDPLDVGRCARSWGAGLVVAAMVERCRRVLGDAASPPPHAHADDRSLWLGVLAALDRLAPVERARGRRSLIRIVTKSTRRDTSSSAVALGRRCVSCSRYMTLVCLNSVQRLASPKGFPAAVHARLLSHVAAGLGRPPR